MNAGTPPEILWKCSDNDNSPRGRGVSACCGRRDQSGMHYEFQQLRCACGDLSSDPGWMCGRASRATVSVGCEDLKAPALRESASGRGQYQPVPAMFPKFLCGHDVSSFRFGEIPAKFKRMQRSCFSNLQPSRCHAPVCSRIRPILGKGFWNLPLDKQSGLALESASSCGKACLPCS